jgi:hypothetical protein
MTGFRAGLVLVFISGCASRNDSTASPTVDERLRTWITVEPKWQACESYAVDEFPPFPKFFKLAQNSAGKISNSGLANTNQDSWVVLECDDKGSCNPGSVFGSFFTLENKPAGNGQTVLNGRPVVKWNEDASAGKCRYVVTNPTLTTENSRGVLQLSLELKAFEVAGTCKPEQVNLDKLQPACTSVRRAEAN